MGFSPGPWRRIGFGALYLIKGTETADIAVVQPRTDAEHAFANANLIAAAPELYESESGLVLTAKAMINNLEGGGPAPLHMIEAGIRDLRAAIEGAEAAIAKARGEP